MAQRSDCCSVLQNGVLAVHLMPVSVCTQVGAVGGAERAQRSKREAVGPSVLPVARHPDQDRRRWFLRLIMFGETSQ
jgi:hypothetical protein